MMLRQAVSGPRSLPPHLHLSSLGVFRLPVSPSGSLRAVAPLPVKLETRDGEWYLLGAYCVLAPAGRCTRPSLDGETFAPLFRRHQRPSRRGPVGTGEAGIWSQDCLKPGTPLPARRWSFLCFCFALRSLCSDSVLHLRAPVEQGRRGAGGGWGTAAMLGGSWKPVQGFPRAQQGPRHRGDWGQDTRGPLGGGRPSGALLPRAPLAAIKLGCAKRCLPLLERAC